MADENVNKSSVGSMPQICCLVDNGTRCTRPAGFASYSKIIEKTMLQRRLKKLVVDPTLKHQYICDTHKSVIQQIRSQQKNRDHNQRAAGESLDSHGGQSSSENNLVNFYLLPVSLLRRYKRHYKLPTKPGINKAQLADAVSDHFNKTEVNEKEVLSYFLYTCKNNKSHRAAAAAAERADSPN